jgi:hypothetical protein
MPLQQCSWKLDKDTEYCVFADPWFASGRGISIPTTAEEAEEIAKTPAFTQPNIHDNLGINQLPNPPFFIAPIPVHGMGVVANRTITKGEWLMSYTPAFFSPEDTYKQLDTRERRKLQYLSFGGLPEGLRKRAEGLDRQSGGWHRFD